MSKKHYHVVAAVIKMEDYIFCFQKGRTKFDYTSFKWEFPGGKVEEGETEPQALHRELIEEMAWDIEVGEHIVTVEHEYPDFSISLSAYLCTPKDCSFDLKEHIAVEKHHINELPKLDWAAADVGIVNELMRLFSTKRI